MNITLHQHIPPHATAWAASHDRCCQGHRLTWCNVLNQAMGQQIQLLVAEQDQRITGLLPMMLLKHPVFGRHLIAMPYVNQAGPLAMNMQTERALVDRAIELAGQLRVKFLELRTDHHIDHPKLVPARTEKVNSTLPLPHDPQQLWAQLDAKVRNQVRKGRKSNLTVHWSAHADDQTDQPLPNEQLIDGFYQVFARNMHDLGSPVFPKALFTAIAEQFGDDAEFCNVCLDDRPVAGAVLIHNRHRHITEVPSASSLRAYNKTCSNMLMYWHLITRAMARRSTIFDFGRSTKDSGTHKFKTQWGAQTQPTHWQRHFPNGTAGQDSASPDRHSFAVSLWQRLPAPLVDRLGPWLIRGIPC